MTWKMIDRKMAFGRPGGQTYYPPNWPAAETVCEVRRGTTVFVAKPLYDETNCAWWIVQVVYPGTDGKPVCKDSDMKVGIDCKDEWRSWPTV